MNIESFERQDIDYLVKQLYNENEELNILPSSFYSEIEPVHVRQFCLEHGVYCLPTTELIEYLKNEIGDKKAIEIGAGHGAISKALGIVATDSYMQVQPEVKVHYEIMRQAICKYGKNVEKYEAEEAVRKYRPDTVVAAWVTHKYNPKQHYREGNMYGVREHKIIEKSKRYVFIGNTSPHRMKPILDTTHKTIEVDWLVSRLYKKVGCKDVIWIWE
jgi:hypothetical protein